MKNLLMKQIPPPVRLSTPGFEIGILLAMIISHDVLKIGDDINDSCRK